MKKALLKSIGIGLILLSLNNVCVQAQGTWSVISGIDEPVQAMYEFQNDLYIGKLQLNSQGGMVKWNGSALTNLNSIPNSSVTAFCEMNNQLYVGGGFTMIGGVPAADVAILSNNSWIPLGSNLINFGINALAVYNGDVYAGGFSFDSLGNPLSLVIAKWDGTTWVDVGGGVSGGDIYALKVYNNELYAAGSFINAGGVLNPFIAKWNGTSWSGVGSGLTTGAAIYALTVFNSELYAAGAFSEIRSASSFGIAKWNGSIWSGVGGVGTDSLAAYALATDGTNLYLGGAFNSVSGVPANHVARWDGSNWSSMGNGVGVPNDFNEQVYCMVEYKGDIYAGGIFTEINGTPGNYLAKWSSTTSIHENSKSDVCINIFPNPVQEKSIITISTQQEAIVNLDIYNLSGQKVASLFNGKISYGNYQCNMNSIHNLSKGVYLLRLVTDDKVSTKQLIIN
jgi:hypothetical protein